MKHIRLFVEAQAIKPNSTIEINDNDFNYLTKVMRKKTGDELLVFNGADGEWLAEIFEINKRNCLLKIIKQTKEQYFPPHITLAFAPVKNVRIDFVAAKATELGITKFQPIITQHTIVDKVNLEKFVANIKEAAEQCERLDLPAICQPIKLENFLKNLQENQIVILCDESGKGGKASEVLENLARANLVAAPTIEMSTSREIIILTGPEGGFSKTEFERFNQIKNLHRITLGPRILRADTAIICATTLVQEFLGDFDLKPKWN